MTAQSIWDEAVLSERDDRVLYKAMAWGVNVPKTNNPEF